MFVLLVLSYLVDDSAPEDLSLDRQLLGAAVVSRDLLVVPLEIEPTDSRLFALLIQPLDPTTTS